MRFRIDHISISIKATAWVLLLANRIAFGMICCGENPQKGYSSSLPAEVLLGCGPDLEEDTRSVRGLHSEAAARFDRAKTTEQ